VFSVHTVGNVNPFLKPGHKLTSGRIGSSYF
jgi:hypothetical protein